MGKPKEPVTLDSLSKGWKGYRIPDVGDYPYPHSHPFFRIHGHGPKDDGWNDYRIPVWRRLKIPDKWFEVPSMAKTILRFWMGCEMGRFKIIDRDQPGKPVPIRLRTGQQMVLRMMFEQAMEGRPIRILVPKYRRQGISTLFQLLFLFIAETLENRHCRTAAHTDESATEIFTIAKTAYKESGHKLSADSASKKRIEIKSQGSTYACLTGAGSFSGSGSTIHCLHVSEMAKFRLNDAQDQRALNSMLNAVSQTGLETIVAIESSGQGPDGEFPDRCRKAAAGLGEYRVCFLKWTMDPTLRARAPKTFVPALGGDELILKHKHGADDEQLQWRRNKLMSDFLAFGRGQSLEDLFYTTDPSFAWEYPVTMEECFGQKSGGHLPLPLATIT